MPLSAKFIERSREVGRFRDDGEGGVAGLYLQITESGAKSWLLRYQVNKGRERMMGLGSAKTFTLRQARERARAARALLADKVDPLVTKHAARAAALAAVARIMTFRQAADRYAEQHAPKWSNDSHRLQFLSSLTAYAFPVLGNMDVAVIDTPAVLRVIEPIWVSKAVTADRVRARIEAVIDWAVVRGHRPAGTNPAKWRGHLDQVLPAPRKVAPVRHHAAMPYAGVPAFAQRLRANEGSAFRALEFLILTATRLSETIGARWNEFDLEGAVWTIPPQRTKSRREHRVPLTAQMLKLLRDLPVEADNDFVFVGANAGGGLTRMAVRYALRQLIDASATTHGFRATFRTWAGERTAFAREVCEAALAHSIGDQSEQAYSRGDALAKRRKLMEAWNRFVSAPPISKGDNVRAIHAAT